MSPLTVQLDHLNTMTQTPGTAANKTYTAEELIPAGYAAYKTRAGMSGLSDAGWLMHIAIEMTGPAEVNDEDEDEVREETPHIWEAADHVVRNQDSALAGRAEGLSCCEAREALPEL